MFDYVIVGGGSAGCVLAARLSGDPTVKVALIEAGPPDDASEIRTPLAFPQLFKTQYDWDYATEPEPWLDGRRVYLPRGRTLGGSSSINAMIYIRGNRADYDDWAAAGAADWGYDAVLPYFVKAEANERCTDQYHGKFGPLSVSDSRSPHELYDAFIEAGLQAGCPYNADFNASQQDGVGRYQLTQRNGMRCSAAVAYLHPAIERTNLTVITSGLATRILFDGPRASGVELVRRGNPLQLRAEREVILSAGTYGSAQLLLLSGIGPATDLSTHQIAVRQDLPVGIGLQDHPAVFVSYFTDTETLFTAFSPENVAMLREEGRGPLSSNCASVGGFLRTRPDLVAPDIQLHAGPSMYYEEGLGAPFDHAYSLGPCVAKPTSRGKVSLRSARPDAKLRILHNYLATREDRECMLTGMRVTLQIAEQEALRRYRRAPHLAPPSDSEADIWEFVKRRCHSLYHPTSTCAIGRVVDNELRVLGVDGLRVVDASVMPSIVRGNTNAPTIMIAEK
jgi:choline dehydrogenase